MKAIEKFKNPLIFTIIILIVINILFAKYKIIYNNGSSMEPFFENGDWIVTERAKSLGKDWFPNRNDVLVIKDEKSKDNLVKRVIALPGELVEIKNGFIYVNHAKVTNPWIKNQRIQHLNEDPIVVPRGHVWVIGDNINISWYGVLPVKNIKGLVIL